jgi:glycosyltransferase involved in cell wall biosynthesis
VRDTVIYITRIDREMELVPGSPIYSSMASMRLRMLIPAGELARTATVKLVPIANFLRDAALARFDNVRAVVIGKLSVSEVETLGAQGRAGLFDAIERCGHPVFADISDNYPAFGSASAPQLLEYQTQLGARATLTVPCSALAEALQAQAQRGVHVIEDPFESPEAPARFAPSDGELRLCWFGAAYEPELVERAFVALAQTQSERRLRVDFVTHASRAPMARQLADRLRAVHHASDVRFVEWSLQNVTRSLADCDVVVLPQDSGSPWGRCKSHNRLVHAIRAGRVAVGSAIPSYRELSDYAQIDDDLAAALRAALEQPEAALQKVRAGQAHVQTRFAPARIAARWASVLGLAA